MGAAMLAIHPTYVAWWWYGGDGPHLASIPRVVWGCNRGEQARPVKTVKVRRPPAGGCGSDRRFAPPPRETWVAFRELGLLEGGTGSCAPVPGIAIDWVTGRSPKLE